MIGINSLYCYWDSIKAETKEIPKMDLNNHRGEIEQFLFDLRDHLKYSIEPAEYENTVNLFGDNFEYQNRKLLDRCEKILTYFSDSSNNNYKRIQNGFVTPEKPNRTKRNSLIDQGDLEDISYLEMSSTPLKTSSSTEYIDFQEQKTTTSTTQNVPISSSPNEEDDDDENAGEENKILDRRIYDICNESPQSNESLKSDNESSPIQDCPYAGLPAAHLSIQKSTKYGHLNRIEKRLFFDQCKKYYCGILHGWLLCYCDGAAISLRPTHSLYLKMPGVEVEHYGEGKRREICFQITTPDPNRKHVFQCNSEVEAKEWIHAIEAAIRGDPATQSVINKNPRRLPTPPTFKKTFSDETISRNSGNNDCIYEEPSPLYNMHQPTDLLIEKKDEDITSSDMLEKQKSLTNIAKKFDYDIPKSPPVPVNSESETAELLDISRSNSDFQTRIKDVHSKLSNQLSTAGPSPERLKKIARKTLSSDSETSSLSATSTKEQKKTPKNIQKPSKSSNPEKSSRNWFLNRLNKSTSSTRNSTTSPTKCKQSEKENLLNNLEICDGYEGEFLTTTNGSAVTKGSKVNMIINQFEASGHLGMFSMDAFNSSHSETKSGSFQDNDCNNYEPIMTGPSNYIKRLQS